VWGEGVVRRVARITTRWTGAREHREVGRGHHGKTDGGEGAHHGEMDGGEGASGGGMMGTARIMGSWGR
jgi:hypothetical protein